MKYKTELHCHSKDASGCAHESAEGIVEKYKKYGYTTICLTNHFTPFPDMEDPEKWAANVEHKYAAYEKLKALAGDDLNILFGLEFRFVQNSNDYLVFGFDKDYLINHGCDILKMGVHRFTEMARQDGIITIQAHPFRYGMTTTPPDHVDGIEIFNGHPGHNSNNDIAEAWAKKYGKIVTSGTDHHDPHHIPDGGIITDVPITSVEQFVNILKSGEYELYRDFTFGKGNSEL